MSFDHQEYKKSLAKFATGVAVVTTNRKNEFFGLTVNSFSSVSLEPPLVLYCLGKSSHNLESYLEGEFFNICILEQSQKHIAELFSKSPNEERFKDNNHYDLDQNNIPLIKNSLASYSCMRHEIIEMGDHYIIVGKVLSFDRNDALEPLTYYNSKYERFLIS